MTNFKKLGFLIILCSLLSVSQFKKNKKNKGNEDKDQKESIRDRDYKGKDIFGPIIGYGPFKTNKGQVADKSYDVGYILGQGFGFKLSAGIKKGIKNSFKPGFFKKAKEEDKSENDK